jgi:hypothetical protein
MVVNGQYQRPRRGSTPERCHVTINAFEFFAMSTPGSKGDRVRSFFLAVRDAWLTSQVVPPEQPNAMMLYDLEMEKL